MDLTNRIAALEAAAGVGREPFADPAYARRLYVEIIEGRAIPLPPLDAVDAQATADLWVRDPRKLWHTLVRADGSEADLAAGEAP
jgi:hypothetical protein